MKVFVPVFLLLVASSGIVVAAAAAEPLDSLRERLQRIIEESDIEAAVAVKELRKGQEVLINPDRSLPIGGGIRIHVITELFRQAAAGRFRLDDPIPFPPRFRTGGLGVLRYMGDNSVTMSLRGYATLVVSAGDNSAANFLSNTVGMEAVNVSLQQQGTPEILFRRNAVRREEAASTSENVATARATIRALEILHRGQVVDRRTSDEIIAILALPEVSYSRRNLPRDVKFAGLSGFGAGIRSDQGIVLFDGRPVQYAFWCGAGQSGFRDSPSRLAPTC
jgi:beta-lactamase class A